MPNVGLEDDSPSSKSESTPEDDQKCVGERGDTISAVNTKDTSPDPQTEITELPRSPRNQTFTNGERRRRKLPEIPKNRKCEYVLVLLFSSTGNLDQTARDCVLNQNSKSKKI